jgi:hypothetical protein
MARAEARVLDLDQDGRERRDPPVQLFPLSALAEPVSVIIGRRPYSDKGVRELSARLVT